VVRLGVVVDRANGVPVLPIVSVQGQAQVEKGDEVEVYVVHDGAARLSRVQVGLVADEVAEVVAGVGVGDRVVTFGANLLRDGAKVQLHRVDGALVETTADESGAGTVPR
jgi:hypothetical protein